MTTNNRAPVFHALHKEGLLILPNAWDAGSARIVEHAGAKAVATSSAAVAWSHGYPDGEAIPPEALISTVREIARVASIPVTADVEAGYTQDPQAAGDFAARIIDAGAVGVNIEDGHDAPELLCAKIEQVRRAAARSGVDVWINARIDVYLHKLAEGQAAYDETVRRARLYGEAGANSIFAPGAVDEITIGNLVREVGLPLNVLAWPGLPDAARLKALGVRRLSAGAGLAKASLGRTHELAEAFLRDGRSDPFFEGSFAPVKVNELMRKD
ncbi:MAG TPA: isocitrate lyase/phosphoenolpyruvate mutase family protein [Rhizomicrobium sp.]|nr:isocitrate lyase/phosphoenolpyruvate mutase family protein [Rhizomicrobium sp.]